MIIQSAAQQISAICNLLCVHLGLIPASKWWQTDILEGINIMSSQNVKHSNGKDKSILNVSGFYTIRTMVPTISNLGLILYEMNAVC